MGTTNKDVFDRIRDYKGDLKKDINHYTINGKKDLKDQLEKMAKDIGVLIANEVNEHIESVYYTIEDAAKYWNVSKQTVYNKIKEEKIKSVRNGRSIRIPKSELDNYFHLLSNNKLIICKSNHELKDENNVVILLFKANSFYKLVFSGKFVVTLFDLENKNKIVLSADHFNKEFRYANDTEINAFKYNMY